MKTSKENLNINELEEGNTLLLQFKKRDGILPVVVQETKSKQILMIASVNLEALNSTFKSGLASFYSTSRKKIWVKGETSGNTLKVNKILVDCDQDALVYQVTILKGGVCHTINNNGQNRKACFYRSINPKTNLLTFLNQTK